MYDMNESSLLGLVAEGEHSRLEFKERPGKDTAAVVSGFANAEGGRMLFGVSDSGEMIVCFVSAWKLCMSEVLPNWQNFCVLLIR